VGIRLPRDGRLQGKKLERHIFDEDFFGTEGVADALARPERYRTLREAGRRTIIERSTGDALACRHGWLFWTVPPAPGDRACRSGTQDRNQELDDARRISWRASSPSRFSLRLMKMKAASRTAPPTTASPMPTGPLRRLMVSPST
jgi:hypothetical protein